MTAEPTRRQKHNVEKEKAVQVDFYSPRRNDVDLSARKTVTMLTGLKYLLFGIILFLLLLTVSRYFGDHATSAFSQSVPLLWFLAPIFIFISISIILSPIDYLKDYLYSVKAGLHSMTLIDVLGRWVRKLIFDSVSFGLAVYLIFQAYYWKLPGLSISYSNNQTFVAEVGLLPYLIILAFPFLLYGILAIPLWTWLRDTFLFISGYGFKRTDRRDENIAKVNLLGKRYGMTILGVYYYHLSGDYSAETKLVGFFGLYFVFLPGTLSGKASIVASASKALARAKGMHGTIKNIVNWFMINLGVIFSLLGFHLSYYTLYPIFTWPSDQAAMIADPSLQFWMLFFLGLFMLLATFVNNVIGKLLDKNVNRLAEKLGFEKLEGYQAQAELGRGFIEEREPLTDLFLIDKAKPER